MKKTEDSIDFNEIIREIESKKILLPDFQRKFVWTKEDQQVRLAASALCRMPMGSILALDSEEKIFGARKIGKNEYVDVDQINGSIDYLLDGQQRVTVLTNIFSEVIHTEGELDSLKRHFYLQIPRKGHKLYDQNLFGFNDLHFKLGADEKRNPNDRPDFMTEDMQELIACYTFRLKDENANNPYHTFQQEQLNVFCTRKEAYLVPLFLLGKDRAHENMSRDRMYYLMTAMMMNHTTAIREECMKKETEEEKVEFLMPILESEDRCKKALETVESFGREFSPITSKWQTDFLDYLKNCIEKMSLHIMGAPNSDRAKAIEVFENMNRGGVKLDTFDLVVARVAKKNNEFMKMLINCFVEGQEYELSCLDTLLVTEYKKRKKCLEEKGDIYCASIEIEGVNVKEEELEKPFKEAFLNVLSLYCNNPDFNEEKIKKDIMCQKSILNLNAEEINLNTRIVCKAMDRAAFFLISSCGIRKISEVNYRLMFTIITYLFMNDEWYTSKEVQGCIKAWYWSAIFSGHYDKDQNTIALQDMIRLIKTIRRKESVSWIRAMKENVFKVDNFSNKDFLLYKNYDTNQIAPKDILGDYICQFYLKETYTDMFDADIRVSVFAVDAKKYEKHHVVPLGSNKKKKSSESRKEKSIYNSPLNYIYITPGSNKLISSDSYASYSAQILPSAYSSLDFDITNRYKMDGNKEEIELILSDRHTKISNAVEKKVEEYLTEYLSN